LSSAAQDAADVVLADGDCLPGETRPVVTLGGADYDLPGVCPAMRARARSCRYTSGFRRLDSRRRRDGCRIWRDARDRCHALLTPRELEVLRRCEGMTNKAIRAPIEHLAHTGEFHVDPCSEIGGAHKD